MDNRQSGVAGKDARVLLAQRKAHGGDFWATKDGRRGVGSPFSTIDCGFVLVELGIRPTDPLRTESPNFCLRARPMTDAYDQGRICRSSLATRPTPPDSSAGSAIRGPLAWRQSMLRDHSLQVVKEQLARQDTVTEISASRRNVPGSDGGHCSSRQQENKQRHKAECGSQPPCG